MFLDLVLGQQDPVSHVTWIQTEKDEKRHAWINWQVILGLLIFTKNAMFWVRTKMLIKGIFVNQNQLGAWLQTAAPPQQSTKQNYIRQMCTRVH